MSRSIGFQDARYVTSPEQNFQGRVGILENFLHCKKTWQPAFFFRCHVISIVWWTIVTPLMEKDISYLSKRGLGPSNLPLTGLLPLLNFRRQWFHIKHWADFCCVVGGHLTAENFSSVMNGQFGKHIPSPAFLLVFCFCFSVIPTGYHTKHINNKNLLVALHSVTPLTMGFCLL